MKLTSSIASNSVKLLDIYNKIISGALITDPTFQRKLVWKKQHKYAFIKTILLNFPFPEVYIASTEVDVATMQAKEVVVDGQQRLTTIVDYIKGIHDFQKQSRIPAFDDLSTEEKKDFLNYLITVKDLKDIGEENVREVFKRINSTDYSLNSNEILNAEYGDGEFSIFCKQLVDESFNPTTEKTDIIINDTTREGFINFFKTNGIFSENDTKRMFDSQYIMLLAATLLEGKYFGRTSKINYYLEKYNSTFEVYQELLKILNNSINIIRSLNLSNNSYWFNKANLFTLLIELRNTNVEDIDLEIFEGKLLELEKKVDIYFTSENDEDISYITEDERKYFEVSRQGSHELAAREHRAKVISKILDESKNTTMNTTMTDILQENLETLHKNKINYATIIPTETGLKKSIMDAITNVRVFLSENNLHNYENQIFGTDSKVNLEGKFITNNGNTNETRISLYRSNGRGDYRIWFSDLNKFAEPNEELALIKNNNEINILNLSKYNYKEFLEHKDI